MLVMWFLGVTWIQTLEYCHVVNSGGWAAEPAGDDDLMGPLVPQTTVLDDGGGGGGGSDGDEDDEEEELEDEDEDEDEDQDSDGENEMVVLDPDHVSTAPPV